MKAGYNRAQCNKRLQRIIVDEGNKIPPHLSYRLRYLGMAMECKFLWDSKTAISISKQVRLATKIIYDYLTSNKPWKSPIGHLIPRDPFYESRGDASHLCIGVTIPQIKVFVLLPFSEALRKRILNKEVHINSLEFIALMLAYIVFLAEYELRPNEFPPHPVLKLRGDSKSANKWMREISTGSIIAQNLLRMFANYLLYSLLKGDTDWIPGDENGEADEVSRVQELILTLKNPKYTMSFIQLYLNRCVSNTKRNDLGEFSSQVLRYFPI